MWRRLRAVVRRLPWPSRLLMARHRLELEKAVAELSQANARAEEAIASKNHFLEGVSYKLRTPLNTIVGLSEMLMDGLCGPLGNAKVEEYLSDIRSAGMDVMTVVDELSTVATVEAAIAADRRSWRTVIEMSPDSICLCRGGLITFINSAGVRLLGGYSAAQFEGKRLEEFVHPDSQPLLDDNFGVIVGMSTSTPMRFRHPSGHYIDVMVSVAAAPEGDGTMVVVARDISDVMRANHDVATQAMRLNNILDTAVDAIVVCDSDGVVETFNRSAEKIFGYTASEVLGRNVTILMDEADASQHDAYIRRYLESHQARVLGIGREVSGRRKDGSLFPCELALSVCQLDDGPRFTAMIRDVTERRNFENHLAHSATHDTLTGLPNRRRLQENLETALIRAEAEGTMVAVWFIDLDGFKTVNDVMGHAAGDELLVDAGRRMLTCVKPEDTVARFGGDEFALIVTGLSGRHEVEAVVERFIHRMSEPFDVMGREVGLTANVGISLYPDHATKASELVVHAGAAMIVAKAAGRNLYRFFDSAMVRESNERLTLEAELRRGIERDELMLQYQPQVSMASGRVVGLEALVRWNHPSWGLVSPVRFIPVAEETGLIAPLGEWVMRQACKDLRQLEKRGATVMVGVNISPRQFADTDVLSLIHQVIEDTGINPGHLDVEITEGCLMNDPEHVLAYLERMNARGMHLSIDDFGTGYSSLNYLKRFPVHTLKIDRSFVIDIAQNPKDEAIAMTIIALAHSMGMTALAEGVEHADQAEILRRHGCDVIQGYYYSKPISFADVLKLADNDFQLGGITVG